MNIPVILVVDPDPIEQQSAISFLVSRFPQAVILAVGSAEEFIMRAAKMELPPPSIILFRIPDSVQDNEELNWQLEYMNELVKAVRGARLVARIAPNKCRTSQFEVGTFDPINLETANGRPTDHMTGFYQSCCPCPDWLHELKTAPFLR